VMGASELDQYSEVFRAAYVAATKASHQAGVGVHIEVSQEAWDYLMAFEQRPVDPAKPWVGGVWPRMEWVTEINIVLETKMPEGFHVVVVSREVIV
jgi:hypothetical protein